MKGRVSSTAAKLISFIIISLILFQLLMPVSTNTVRAQDDTGVGVIAVRPRITEINLEQNFGTEHLRFKIFDLNSWKHVSKVSVEFYRSGKLVRHYVFNQTRDLERSIEVRKGDGLVNFESESSEKRETVEQRCTLKLHFQFSGINYDRLTIRARDHAGGTSKSTLNFQGVTTGRPMTFWLLPFLILATAVIIYKTVEETGGEIDGT